MPDYKKSKIYKIESIIGNVIYYGATTQKLYSRWSTHKQNYLSGKGCYSRVVLQYNDAKMILIKNCKATYVNVSYQDLKEIFFLLFF